MSVEDTLAERGARYGDFAAQARLSQTLLVTMQTLGRWDALDQTKRQALAVIVDKIARILNGDPEYADNWHDIQGYARLVEERLKA